MIKTVKVTNHLGESLTMELRSPEKSGFLIRSIEGLGPSKAYINTTEIFNSDGSLFNSSRINTRNIVLSLLFLDKPTVEHVRQLSYKYFPIKKPIHLYIETDNRYCETYGYVESNEPNIFSKTEGTQISIICPDPYFYSVDKGRTIFSGIDMMFQFPFSNESTTEDLIEISSIKSDTSQNIFYAGDSDIGMVITIHAKGEVSNITIYNTDTRESMTINTDIISSLTGSGIIYGDDIIISTLNGQKYALLLRGGVYYNILNAIERGANWFKLVKGNNTFAYSADEGVEHLEFMIENQIAYEGV
jgi:hypothetical protein